MVDQHSIESGGGAIFYGLFDYFLHLPFPEGTLLTWLNLPDRFRCHAKDLLERVTSLFESGQSQEKIMQEAL